MRWRSPLLTTVLLLPLAACSVSFSDGAGTTVDLRVTMIACAEDGPCMNAPVPDAEVLVAGTDGGELWSGATRRDGTVHADFEPSSEWTLRVTSPFFAEPLESEVVEAGHGTHHSMSLSPPARYVLRLDPDDPA